MTATFFGEEKEREGVTNRGRRGQGQKVFCKGPQEIKWTVEPLKIP